MLVAGQLAAVPANEGAHAVGATALLGAGEHDVHAEVLERRRRAARPAASASATPDALSPAPGTVGESQMSTRRAARPRSATVSANCTAVSAAPSRLRQARDGAGEHGGEHPGESAGAAPPKQPARVGESGVEAPNARAVHEAGAAGVQVGHQQQRAGSVSRARATRRSGTPAGRSSRRASGSARTGVEQVEDERRQRQRHAGLRRVDGRPRPAAGAQCGDQGAGRPSAGPRGERLVARVAPKALEPAGRGAAPHAARRRFPARVPGTPPAPPPRRSRPTRPRVSLRSPAAMG